MDLEWDEEKNVRNFRKHGVWFEEAQTIWADDLAVEFYDSEYEEAEQRYLRVGHSTRHRLLLVVFCERHEDVVRINSARRATSNERRDYEKGI